MHLIDWDLIFLDLSASTIASTFPEEVAFVGLDGDFLGSLRMFLIGEHLD